MQVYSLHIIVLSQQIKETNERYPYLCTLKKIMICIYTCMLKVLVSLNYSGSLISFHVLFHFFFYFFFLIVWIISICFIVVIFSLAQRLTLSVLYSPYRSSLSGCLSVQSISWLHSLRCLANRFQEACKQFFPRI